MKNKGSEGNIWVSTHVYKNKGKSCTCGSDASVQAFKPVVLSSCSHDLIPTTGGASVKMRLHWNGVTGDDLPLFTCFSLWPTLHVWTRCPLFRHLIAMVIISLISMLTPQAVRS